jgi:cytochrome P450
MQNIVAALPNVSTFSLQNSDKKGADERTRTAYPCSLRVLGSANRDERHFEDPDVLDLARDPNRHLAFGRGGVHHCLGAPLARMEGQIALTALMRRFPGARLAMAPEALRWRRGLFLRGLEKLPLVL